VTFKDLRKIISEKNKEMEVESRFYDPNYFWKGRKIVSLDQWYQVEEGYGNTFLMILSMEFLAFLII
jgi:hypothetical protein